MTGDWIALYVVLGIVFVLLSFGPVLVKAFRPSAAFGQPDEPDPRRDISARPCWAEVEMGNRLEREVAPGIDLQDGQP